MKKILTIQDISCVGQCSLTVALPIISAMSIECCILPSAVLSTHTGGFKGYTFRDLTEDLPPIANHWKNENITFDGIYTGYIGSTKQIEYIKSIIDTFNHEKQIVVVDPAMADHGKLYYGFDEAFVEEMKTLCSKADYIVPNITEACFLTNTPYFEKYNQKQIEELLIKLSKLGPKYTASYTLVFFIPEITLLSSPSSSKISSLLKFSTSQSVSEDHISGHPSLSQTLTSSPCLNMLLKK